MTRTRRTSGYRCRLALKPAALIWMRARSLPSSRRVRLAAADAVSGDVLRRCVGFLPDDDMSPFAGARRGRGAARPSAPCSFPLTNRYAPTITAAPKPAAIPSVGPSCHQGPRLASSAPKRGGAKPCGCSCGASCSGKGDWLAGGTAGVCVMLISRSASECLGRATSCRRSRSLCEARRASDDARTSESAAPNEMAAGRPEPGIPPVHAKYAQDPGQCQCHCPPPIADIWSAIDRCASIFGSAALAACRTWG